MGSLGGLLIVGGAFFVVPAFIARFVIGDDWRQVGGGGWALFKST